MRKLFTLLFAVVVSMTAANAEVYEGHCGDGLEWSLDTVTGLLEIFPEGHSSTLIGIMDNYTSSADGDAPWWDYRKSITSVSFPERLPNIGDYAFYLCPGITSINIPSTVARIGDYAFSATNISNSLVIPDQVFYIGKLAFAMVPITSLTIGSSVDYIGKSAFDYCINLKQIICRSETPPVCEEKAFDDVDKSIPLYVPDVNAYRLAPVWSEFTNIQKDPNYIDIATNGELPGIFSFYDGKVRFSKGNLQYNESTDTWRFAPKQWNTTEYGGWFEDIKWVDSFDYGKRGAYNERGENAISNGGNQPNKWYTPRAIDWEMLILWRPNAENLYGFGNVEGVDGLILLPDDWVKPNDVSFTTGKEGGMVYKPWINIDNNRDTVFMYYENPVEGANSYLDNVYNTAEWNKMEAAGAVFLPGTNSYWSSSETFSSFFAYVLQFGLGNFNYNFFSLLGGTTASDIEKLLNIRLVCDVEENGIEEVFASTDVSQVRKVLVDGQVYLLRNGKVYTLQGQEVK